MWEHAAQHGYVLEGGDVAMLQLKQLFEYCDQRGLALETGGVAFGGSIAYGLDTPESDIDLRGFVPPSARDIVSLHDFGTLNLDEGIDATLHSLAKFCSLLLACNPSCIETLGVLDEHVLVESKAFDTLRAHRDWFVTRRCGATFGGYATQQLRRIENALNREDPHLANQNAIRSVKSSIESISDRYPSLEASSFEPIERDGEVVLSGQLKEADLAELKAFAHECNESVKTANDLATRNIKRPSGKLAKHASHLIRLLRMGAEMLETGAINTWRGEDHDLLLAIKQGMWLNEAPDGTRSYDDEFWELVHDEQTRFERAKRETSLPASPDEEAVWDFVRDTHRQIVVNS